MRHKLILTIFVALVISMTCQAQDDYSEEIQEITKEIKQNPDDTELYSTRAGYYMRIEKYKEAEKDCRKMIELEEWNPSAYFRLGLVYFAQDKFDEALDQFNYAIKLSPTYSQPYAYRAHIYCEAEEYEKAIDDVIEALVIDYNDKAFQLVQTIAEFKPVPLNVKLKEQKRIDDNDEYWDYCIGVVYYINRAYESAIWSFEQCLEITENSATASLISDCYEKLGDYEQALKYNHIAMTLDPEDPDYLFQHAILNDEAGNTEEALKYISICKDSLPDSYMDMVYYISGWIKENSRDHQGAIEDYTTSISLNSEYAYNYLSRGNLYLLLGREEEARADYRQAILLDTIPGNNSVAHYAYYHLGDKEKAIDFLNQVLALDDDKGNHYDAACLYSIMGDTKQALYHLEQSLEKGFRRFVHINRDDDLDNIRQLPEFRELIEKYQEE